MVPRSISRSSRRSRRDLRPTLPAWWFHLPHDHRPGTWVLRPDEADPNDGITLTYEEFVEAIDRLASVDFPLERSNEEAWRDFVGWRVNYEAAAYAIARAVDAPPALWSGPRRHPIPTIPPLRPAVLRAGESTTEATE